MGRELPERLRAALDGLLEGVSRHALAERSAALTEAYRATGTARFSGRDDLIAYAVARMPATFAAVSAALAATLQRLGDWRPRTLLDLGSGPGTAVWAATELIDAIESAATVERDAGMLALAAELGAPVPVERRQGDLADTRTAFSMAGLVTAAYVLGELALDSQTAVVSRAWAACSGVLLLVEPGTPAGAQRIQRARLQLIAAGAQVIAPCTHALACPLTTPSWCHFPARLARSRAHMAAKGAVVPFEDEKFSYLAVSRLPVELLAAGRIVAPPAAAKPGTTFMVCRDGALSQSLVPSRDRAAHKAARKLGWGDLLG